MTSEPVPPQPTLVDGAVTLRPWRADDAEAARLQHDEEIARWFRFPGVTPSAEQQGAAIERWQRDYADGRRVVSFVVEVDGRVAGSVEVRRTVGRDATGHLSWALFPDFRGRGHAVTAVRLLVDYAFGDLGLARVEAYVDPDNRRSVRLATRAGLRREGELRGYESDREGVRRDAVLLARLADDPEVGTGEMFRAALNAGLPRKRTISQGLVRNQRGEVLLCELTYKRYWDLPGGVVDPDESPAHAVLREVGEELQVPARLRRLVVVSWLPPWQGWDDAMLYLFELSVAEDEVARATLEPREIRAIHWADAETVRARCAPYTARLIEHATQLLDAGAPTAYLEDGEPPTW
ncbi:RimJ/RimL family protein N-acetyltransferase [Barrientosiimonas humi]|uniref:RimJ/RimL family protein N-acetyltransferase n=1 Tax=Barrientosiimonas humi TaxID=999931 RepID=A0A542WZA3_9MICO|nr:GNAT family N-acetyltransferase [Barrientosiimonas humi]TQL28910.1 RimJ/RimL family protein N-acetyltransferase [Barrientosiimonas humi]CAG7571278.1 Spermidine N(1)-acetyltransferase [Barrientosiimonas humi]